MDEYVKDKIIERSEEILEALLAFKNVHPEFTFALRERDNARSEEKRLEEGQWFQGSDYIYVPLFSQGDDIRRVKTIGFVLTFDVDGSIYKNYIEISFKSENLSENEKEFHRELAESIGLELDSKNNGKKEYDNPNNYLQNLNNYITDFRIEALNLLKKYNLEDKYIIPEAKFQKNLERIQKIKSNLGNLIFKDIKIIYPESFIDHGQFQKNFRIALKIPENVERVDVKYNDVVYKNLYLGEGPNARGRIRFDSEQKKLFLRNNPDLKSNEKITIGVAWIPDTNKQQKNEIKKIENKYNMEPFNQILYGPPGTGKTYSTINMALKIINEKEERNLDWNDRNSVKIQFDKRLAEGQIVFTTFHQNMSYEDFIEGIKPVETDGNISYEIKDGIFKKLCNTSKYIAGNFEAVIEKFKAEISEEDGKVPLTINGKGTSFDIKYKGTDVFYVQPHNSAKLEENPWYPVNITKIRKSFESGDTKGFYNPTYIREVIKYLTENYSLEKGSIDKEAKNYVLIIDEINRGNVSQIFGELITLIEEDKRLSKDEALEVTLTYSKEKFGVPPNLYIIGTMNTADRSVEALDSALRRRFSFTEIRPKHELLTPMETLRRFWAKTVGLYGGSPQSYENYERDIRKLLGLKILDEKNYIKYGDSQTASFTKEEFESNMSNIVEFNGIDLSELLSIINSRIEILLDKDHQIGHSYFISMEKIEELKYCFQNKIIPLLQEYFYGDYGKIGLVLGQGFVTTEEKKDKTIFAKFEYAESSDYTERVIFTLKDLSKMSIEEFTEAIELLINK